MFEPTEEQLTLAKERRALMLEHTRMVKEGTLEYKPTEYFGGSNPEISVEKRINDVN